MPVRRFIRFRCSKGNIKMCFYGKNAFQVDVNVI